MFLLNVRGLGSNLLCIGEVCMWFRYRYVFLMYVCGLEVCVLGECMWFRYSSWILMSCQPHRVTCW